VSIANFPETSELQNGATAFRGRPRHASGRITTALDVARTLLVLVFIGMGIVMLRLLLVLAQGAMGH
jgi:hypothetical protein